MGLKLKEKQMCKIVDNYNSLMKSTVVQVGYMTTAKLAIFLMIFIWPYI